MAKFEEVGSSMLVEVGLNLIPIDGIDYVKCYTDILTDSQCGWFTVKDVTTIIYVLEIIYVSRIIKLVYEDVQSRNSSYANLLKALSYHGKILK